LIQSGRIFVDSGGPVSTGVAFANPNTSTATISCYFTDAAGRDFGHGSFVMPAGQQTSHFLTEAPFNLPSTLQGTFTFASTQPVSAIALRGFVNERNEFLVTTLPVAPLGVPFGNAGLILPHFADGGGWATQVVLINPDDTTLSGSIQFYGQGSKAGSAQPVKVLVNGVTSSNFKYSIPRRSAVQFLTVKSRPATEVGSVHINPSAGSGMPSAIAVFSYKENGVTLTSASVPAAPPDTTFRMFVESSGVLGSVGSIESGFTIANPSSSKVNVQLTITKLDGTPTGISTSMEIPAGGHIAKFANELFPTLPNPFKGVMKVTAPTPVGVSALRSRYNERGELLLTTTPPFAQSAAQVGSELAFPHIAQGGGYATQLVLLSTGLRHAGGLMMVSKDGGILSGVLLQSAP
jgi:hypothetical protein